eukprot:TRINITY_DN38359_c0_g1_i1.p1 TRINITY_DN38359_c0_g1~~TRINITY_DN38359_c0_g1_i1.p1  ORF type:complete len:282 (-),score=63.35 TRINITY_DN38359_c0_g1_i1:177-1022(-)
MDVEDTNSEEVASEVGADATDKAAVLAPLFTAAARIATIREMPLAKDIPELLAILARLEVLPVNTEALKLSRIGAEVNHNFLRRHVDDGVRQASASLASRWRTVILSNASSGLPYRLLSASALANPLPDIGSNSGSSSTCDSSGMGAGHDNASSSCSNSSNYGADRPEEEADGNGRMDLTTAVDELQGAKEKAALAFNSPSDFLSRCRAGLASETENYQKKRNRRRKRLLDSSAAFHIELWKSPVKKKTKKPREKDQNEPNSKFSKQRLTMAGFTPHYDLG